MKKLLILPLLILLTGCVSYYYPETAYEDGVYYAEDDPSYVVSSGVYTTGVYYPWYSLDYFYLGYYPSPSYSFAYAYPSGFSIGFNYGFSPWYYPSHYYGYYSPWYGSGHHHHYYPAWRPYRGYNSHHYNRYRKDHRGGRHDRYAGNDRDDEGRHDKDRYDRHDRYDRRNRSDDKNRRGNYSSDRYRSSSVRRYVSTAPGGQGSNRGMVVRSRDSAKVGKSRLHVDQSAPGETVKPKSTQPRVVTQPTYSTKNAASEVRYRSNTKQGRSHTGPVSPAANSRGLVVKSAPVNGGRSSNADGARQAPVRVVSNQSSNQQKQSKASHSRNNKPPRAAVQSSPKQSGGRQKSTRSANRK